MSSSNGSFTTLKEIISSAKEKLNTILSELNAVEDGEKYDQFIRILSTDPEVMGEFFCIPLLRLIQKEFIRLKTTVLLLHHSIQFLHSGLALLF